ncbi:MAG TPA: tripartite tricarboxylate transporter TctB family protein [Thermodesulfobacteriota bacterium]
MAGLTREVLTGGVVALVGSAVLAYIRSQEWTGLALAGGMSPKLFPGLAAAAMTGGGLVIVVAGLWRARSREAGAGVGASEAEPEAALPPLALWLGSVLYAALLPHLGFLAATPLFLFSLIVVWGVRGWATRVCFTVGYTAALFYVFERLLGVPLPSGPWG